MSEICREIDCKKFDSMEKNHCQELMYVPRERACVEFERICGDEKKGKKPRRRDED